jgi:short-subunit dehydrogenase
MAGVRDETALITGASSGIGLEMAGILAANGFDLFLVARNEPKLRELADRLRSEHGVEADFQAVDLSHEDGPDRLYERLVSANVRVDVLVNNAGFAQYGRFVDTDPAAEREMMQVNMIALTRLTKLVVPSMMERGSGKILNVASTAAFQPGPLMAVYYATKAYVLSFSYALENELRGTGVSLTALCPGPTQSGFQERADMEESKLVRRRIADARSVAYAGYEGLMKNKPIVIPGTKNKLLAHAVRLSPRRLTASFVRRMQERAPTT